VTGNGKTSTRAVWVLEQRLLEQRLATRGLRRRSRAVGIVCTVAGALAVGSITAVFLRQAALFASLIGGSAGFGFSRAWLSISGLRKRMVESENEMLTTSQSIARLKSPRSPEKTGWRSSGSTDAISSSDPEATSASPSQTEAERPEPRQHSHPEASFGSWEFAAILLFAVVASFVVCCWVTGFWTPPIGRLYGLALRFGLPGLILCSFVYCYFAFGRRLIRRRKLKREYPRGFSHDGKVYLPVSLQHPGEPSQSLPEIELCDVDWIGTFTVGPSLSDSRVVYYDDTFPYPGTDKLSLPDPFDAF